MRIDFSRHPDKAGVGIGVIYVAGIAVSLGHIDFPDMRGMLFPSLRAGHFILADFRFFSGAVAGIGGGLFRTETTGRLNMPIEGISAAETNLVASRDALIDLRNGFPGSFRGQTV